MATHYKGERITDLLAEIDQLKEVLDSNRLTTCEDEDLTLARAYTSITLAKAKLTALMGD